MALDKSIEQQLKTFFQALQDKPLQDDDIWYVPELNAVGASGADPIDEMTRTIDWQEGSGVCLFTGQRGTGKSTELLRLQKNLEKNGIVAFYADLGMYLNDSKPVEITELLLVIAGALSDCVRLDLRLGSELSKPSFWERAANFLQSKVVLEGANLKLGFQGQGLDLKANIKTDPLFKERIQEAMRGHLSELVKQVQGFVAEAVNYVRQTLGNPNQKVVLIIDSIERIRGVGKDERAVYESIRALFVNHADKLEMPLLHMVYTVPPYLSVLVPGAGSLMGGATLHSLVSTHVFQARSRTPDPVGLKKMQAIIAARFKTWPDVISPAALDDLALTSGGDLREFFRLLRPCLTAVQKADQLPLSLEAVTHAKNSVRNAMLPIPQDQLVWLAKITHSFAPCLASVNDLPTMAHFLDTHLVLNYRNGQDWYDVHPLIRETVDQSAQA